MDHNLVIFLVLSLSLTLEMNQKQEKRVSCLSCEDQPYGLSHGAGSLAIAMCFYGCVDIVVGEEGDVRGRGGEGEGVGLWKKGR